MSKGVSQGPGGEKMAEKDGRAKTSPGVHTEKQLEKPEH